MKIFKREKHVRKLVMAHLDEVFECLKETRSVLEDYTTGNVESVHERSLHVIEIESRADELERQIRNALLDGAFLPHIRSDVYRLVEAVDSVAGKSEDVARFLRTQKPKIPQSIEMDLMQLFRRSLDCFQELRKALRDYFKPKGRIENLHEHVGRVSEIETEVDQIESEIAANVFNSDLDLSEKIHLEQLVKRIADLADLSH